MDRRGVACGQERPQRNLPSSWVDDAGCRGSCSLELEPCELARLAAVGLPIKEGFDNVISHPVQRSARCSSRVGPRT